MLKRSFINILKRKMNNHFFSFVLFIYLDFDKKVFEYPDLRKFGFLRRKSTSCRIYSSARNHPEPFANPTRLPSAKRYTVESYPCPIGASSTPDRWEYIIIRARGAVLRPLR